MIGDFCVSLIFLSDKTLCPASPSLQWVAWVSLPHLPGLSCSRPSVLCSAKTTASPSRVASLVARFQVPRLSHYFVRVPLGSHSGCRMTVCAWPACIPVAMVPVRLSRGVGGPLKFPGYPCMHMPRSTSPVVPQLFAITQVGLTPSSQMKLSAFPVTTTGYPRFP